MYICVKHKKKEKTKLYILLYHTLTQRILSTSITCHFPLFLSPFPSSHLQLPTVSASSLALFPTSGFTSFFLLYLPSLSVYLSVCLSVTRHFTRSLTRSVSHTVRITPIHLVHSLAHSLTRSRSHTGWVSLFFFYSIHDDCTCVTTWTCKIGHLSCCLVLFIFFSCEAKIDQQKKIYVALQILTQIEKYEMACV